MQEMAHESAQLEVGAPPDDRPASLAHSAAWQLASTVARGALGLVSVSLYTHLLGMSRFGVLALVQTVVAPLVVLDAFGWATVKYVSEALGRRDTREATRVVHSTMALNLVVGIAGALALTAGARWFATSVFVVPPEDVERAILCFRIIAVFWLTGVLSSAFVAVLVAHQAYGVVARLAMVSVALSAGMGAAAAALWRDPAAVLLAQVAAGLIMVAVYFRQAARRLPAIAAVPRWDPEVTRRTLAFGGWQLLATGGALLTAWGDRYVLATSFVPTVVGFYAVAQHLTGQLQAAFVEMGDVVFPAVSHLHGKGDLASARALALRAGWTLTLGFGICATTLAVIGGDFLALWISPDAAREAEGALRLMCVGGMLWVTGIVPLAYVVGLGRIRWEALTNVGSGVVLLVTSFALVPRLGLAGIGYGLIAASLVRCLSVFGIWRLDRAEEGSFAFTWSPAIVAMSTLGVFAVVHDRWMTPPGWLGLVLETALVLICAAAVQLGIGEMLSGGPKRRVEMLAHLRLAWARALGRSGR